MEGSVHPVVEELNRTHMEEEEDGQSLHIPCG